VLSSWTRRRVTTPRSRRLVARQLDALTLRTAQEYVGKVDHEIVGLYEARTPSATTLGSISQAHVTFFGSGDVYRGIPPEGLAVPLDMEAMRRNEPTSSGRYELNGDTVSCVWETGDTTECSFSRPDWIRDLYNGHYGRCHCREDLRLSGLYRFSQEFPFQLRFTEDGGFTNARPGLLELIGRMRWARDVARDPRYVTLASHDVGSGTYRVLSNTLALRYDDGREANIPFWTGVGDVNPDDAQVVSLQSYNFTRIGD